MFKINSQKKVLKPRSCRKFMVFVQFNFFVISPPKVDYFVSVLLGIFFDFGVYQNLYVFLLYLSQEKNKNKKDMIGPPSD